MERRYRDGASTYEGGGGGGTAPGKRTRTQELPAGTRSQFESSLGADLSGVRLHTGEESAEAAAGLGARAFTTGQDIHFGAGQFKPDDPFGMHLLAHEVAHTQQPDTGQPRLKGEGDAPSSDPQEAAADKAADAMVAGQPGAHFVPFTADGTWVAQDVLGGLGSVPPAMRAAIEEGVGATAQFCVELRRAVQAAGGDPSIVAALTSRINELAYATSRSPLTYGQLRQVAAWSEEFGTGKAAKTDEAKEEAKQPTPPGSADAIEARAAKIAGAGAGYVDEGKKDPYRKDIKGLGPNQVIRGEDADPPLAGHDFRYDPFDNTVVVVRREEGTGIQYTYDAVKTDAGVTMTLVRTEELSKLRVGALARMDEAALGEKQETPEQQAARLAADRKKESEQRAEWRKNNETAAGIYDQQIKDWQALPEAERKKTPMPKPPDGYPPNIHTTLCPAFVSKPYNAGGGKDSGKLVNFPFTPPIKDEAASWRTLETQPEGPKPGDVYWIAFSKGGSTAHMGVVKSRSPADGFPGQEMWVVTDGGQGGYANLQMAYERQKGPFDPKTGYFGDTGDSGQRAGRRYLTGWVDIEAFHKSHGGDEETVEV